MYANDFERPNNNDDAFSVPFFNQNRFNFEKIRK